MNVYQIPPDPKGGCYEDNTNGKRLFDVDTKTFQSPTISDDMSQTRYRKDLGLNMIHQKSYIYIYILMLQVLFNMQG